MGRRTGAPRDGLEGHAVDPGLIVGGWLLVGVLVLAGLSKLRNASATAQTLVDFGVPQPVARQAAPLLPWLELALAALLLVPGLAWPAALVTTALLAIFTLAVSVALVRGHRPNCNCFGQVRARPITAVTALRDALFTTCAGALAWAGAEGLAPGLLAGTALALGRVQGFALALAVLGALVAVQSWLLLHLARQHGRLLLKIDNLELKLQGLGVPATGALLGSQVLPQGTHAPQFAAGALSGRQVSLQTLLDQRQMLLLLFVSADCAPCHELVAELPGLLQRDGLGRLVVISSGSAEANRRKFNALPPEQVLVQTAFEVNELFGVVATPSALRLDRDGRVDSDLAIGGDAIKLLLGPVAPATAKGRPALFAGAGPG